MPILISHRGNIDEINLAEENSPQHIDKAIRFGLDVEIDVWLMNNIFYLGHDEPKYMISAEYLENRNLWCHAKNLPALTAMVTNKRIHCFWHQNDDFTVTSNGYVWTYVNKELSSSSICVLPEINDTKIPSFVAGICSDMIINYA